LCPTSFIAAERGTGHTCCILAPPEAAPVEIIGKYLVTGMTRSTALIILFGRTEEDPQKADDFVLVAGRVVGEAAVGLWVDIEEVVNRDGMNLLTPAVGDPAVLVRWDLLSNARLHADRPSASAMGFRLR
jgi:hypothetical protein